MLRRLMSRMALLVLSLPVLTVAAPAVAAAAKPTIAVTYFENNTGKVVYDPLSRGLAEMLITDLGRLSGIQVVERARLNELMKEIELAKGPYINAATAVKMGRGLGARYVLTGSFTSIEPIMRIDARVVDVRTGKVVYATKASGPTKDFFELEKELALGLIQGIGVKLSVRESAKLGRVATESFGAFKAWSKGLDALDRGKTEAARRALAEALQKDNGFGAARKVLDGLQAELNTLGDKRQQLLLVDTAALVKKLHKIRANRGPYERVPQLMNFRSIGASMPAGARKVRVITRLLLNMKLPERIEFGAQGARLTVNSWALANYVLASYYLKAHADVVTYGQLFMKRYPRSSYFGLVETFVRVTISDLKKAAAGRRKMPELLANAELHRKRLRCRWHRGPATKVRDCAAWVTALAAARHEKLDDGIRALMNAAKRAPEPAMMAIVQKTIRAATKDRVVRQRLQRLTATVQAKYYRADVARSEIARATCIRHPSRKRRLAACRRRASLSLSLKEYARTSALLSVLSEAGTPGHRPADMIAAAHFVTKLSRKGSTRTRADTLRQMARQRDAAATAAGRPSGARAIAATARTLWKAGRARAASRVLDGALARHPTEYNLHHIAITLALDANDLAAARTMASRYRAAANIAQRYNADRLTRYIDTWVRKVKTYDDDLADEYDNTAEDFYDGGRRKEARRLLREGLRLFPTNKELHQETLSQASKSGDIAAMQKALARWKKAVGADAVDPYAQKTVAALVKERLREADDEAVVLEQLAGQMRRVNLWRKAADLYLKVARKYSKTGFVSEAPSLLNAAATYGSAGDIKKSRALCEELMRRFENTPQAAVARGFLATLPR